MTTPVDPFPDAALEAVSAVLADTDNGLTGTEIGRILAACGLDDPAPGATKRHRLHAALSARQQRDRVGNCVAAFVHHAMNPVRYTGVAPLFEARRQDLNQALGFSGLVLGDDGRLRRTARTRTLSEAAQRANRLRNEMHRRRAHGEVLRYCREELVADDCFDAVFEAIKGLGQRIRDLSGVDDDGAALVTTVFALGQSNMPMYAINSLRTDSERSEQKGFVNLVTGVFSMFRNPAAHVPKVKWHVDEQDTVDLLSTLSLVHRRLDRAVRTAPSAGATA